MSEADHSSNPFDAVNPYGPTQSVYGLPPAFLPGSVFSSPVAGQVPDVNRAAAEAVAGDASCRRLEYAKAWEQYRRAVALNPSNANHHYRAGMAALRAGRREAAEQSLIEALRLVPNHADAHEALAQCCMECGQLERALRHSQAACLLDPKSIDYIMTRAAVLIADGQKIAASELIKPLLNAGARHPRLASLYARVAPGLGHEQPALVAVERALQERLNPLMESQLHFDATALLDRLGRYDEAFAHALLANQLAAKPFRPESIVQAERELAYL